MTRLAPTMWRAIARTARLSCAAALCVAAACAAAWAQAPAQPYPSRVVRIVVPSPAGGPTDIGARLIGQKLSALWGQPVVIDNRPGGNNMIGTEAVARAAPDGYTLLMALDSTFTMHPSLYSKLPYDPARDFAPVALAFLSPLTLITDAAKGPKTLQEFVQMARTPGAELFVGAGTLTSQLAVTQLRSAFGLQLQMVAYKGSAGTTQGLLSGDVTATVDGAVTSLAHIRSGRLRVLANLSQHPISALPQLPTIATELGRPDFDVSVWIGLVAPAGVPPAIVAQLNQEVVRILALPDVREKLAAVGLEPGGGTPAEFSAFIGTEAAKWSQLIKASGFKVTE